MARIRKSILPLNLYKYDVLIEDNRTRSEYFRVTQFDGVFHGGRNGFLLAGASVLRPGSKILVEILNKDGTTVYSAPVSSFVEGNSRLIQVEVYDDTPIGPGKIVVLGCADTYLDGTPVPSDWQGKYNVRWISDVVISPTIQNKSPIRFAITPTMTVSEKFYPSPATASFSESVSLPIDITLTPKYYNVFPNGYELRVNGVGKNIYTSEYVGGTITGSLQFLTNGTPETASIQLPITKIYNDTSAESVGSLIYTDKSKTLVLGGYLSSSTNYVTELTPFGNVPVTGSTNLLYNKLVTTKTGSFYSYANVRIVDTETLSGEVNQIRLSYKPTSDPSDYIALADITVKVQELLATDSSSKIVPLGKFTDINLPMYWYAATMSLEKNQSVVTPPNYYNSASVATNLSVIQSSNDLLDAVHVNVPISASSYQSTSYFIGTTTSASVLLFPRSEYTLAFDAFVSRTSGSVALIQNDYSLEVYLVPQENSTTKLLTDDLRGQLIGELTPSFTFKKQNFGRVELNFTPEIIKSGQFGLRFVVYGGFWDIANVSIKPAEEAFFSPDEINVLVPVADFEDTVLTFRAEFIDINHNSAGVVAESLPVYFTGSRTYVRRTGDTMTGELYINNFPVYNSLLENGVTGLTSGGLITINPTYLQAYNISAGQGRILDNSSDPLNPIYAYVTWSAFTGVTASAFASSGSVASWPRTQIAIKPDGTILEQQDTFDVQDYRDYIVLGRIAHVSSSIIQRTLSLPLTTYAKHYHWFDLSYSIGVINLSGNVFSAASTNLTIKKTAGKTYRIGSNYKFDSSTPDITTDSASDPTTFAYRYRNGSGGFREQPTTTQIVGGYYDDGSGTLQVVNNNFWTIQRIYFFGATATTRIQYGQNVYNSLTDAKAAVFNEAFVADENLSQDATLRAYLLVRGGAADLSISGDAEFITAESGLGGSSGGSGGATTLESLSDVDASNPTNGDILVYSASAAQWKHVPRYPYSGSAEFIGNVKVTGSLQIYGNVSGSTYTSSIQNGVGFVGTASFAQTSSVANSVSFTTFSNASYYFPQNVRVEGTLTAQELRTEYITSSIIYESGSTQFGDSLDDTHIFTGSLRVNGSITGSLFGTSSWAQSSSIAISSSYAITASYAVSSSQSITGSYAVSSSRSITGSYAITSSYVLPTGLPTGVVSSSTQLPTGIISSSTFSSPSQGTVRVVINGANGTTTDVDTGLQTGDSPTFTTVSASLYTSSINNAVGFVGTASYAVSSSRSITGSYAITSSYVLPTGLPTGVVSSSTVSSPSQGTVRLTNNGVSGGDIDTGLQTGDSPSFAGLTVDTNTLYVDAASDQVGIGTIAPGAKLHVQGNVSASSYTSSLNNQVGYFGTASYAVSASWAPSTQPSLGPLNIYIAQTFGGF